MFISRNLALRKAEIQSLQNHLLEKDLENQKKDLTHIAINVKENSEWLEVLHDKIKEFVSSSEEDRNKALRKLNSFIINRKQAAALSDELVAKVERLNTRFYSKLQKKYPNLTSYEVKLCSLIRIGLSSKQIASILNINHDSVNKSRYRLRKKLALSPHQEIILFLKNV
jgi:DNA-binding CsgD family transcriptional regulator